MRHVSRRLVYVRESFPPTHWCAVHAECASVESSTTDRQESFSLRRRRLAEAQFNAESVEIAKLHTPTDCGAVLTEATCMGCSTA